MLGKNYFPNIKSFFNYSGQYGGMEDNSCWYVVIGLIVLIICCLCSSSSVAGYYYYNKKKETFDSDIESEDTDNENNEECKLKGKTYSVKTPFGNYCI